MNRLVGMNPDAVRAKVGVIRAQITALDYAEQQLRLAALASLNPASYAVQPGGIILAPAAIAATQSALSRLGAAKVAVGSLLDQLVAEIAQQEAVSSRADNSYIGGAVPTVRRAEPSRPKGFWQTLLGDAVGNWAEAIKSAMSAANGAGRFLTGLLAKGGQLAGILRGVGGALAGVGLITNTFDLFQSTSRGEGWATFDAIIGIVLSAAAVVAAVATPVGWVAIALAVVSIGWSAASVASGDKPVMQAVYDGDWLQPFSAPAGGR